MSMQQVLDCLSPNSYGCAGGFPYMVYEYLQQAGGQDSFSCYPYHGNVGRCAYNPACNIGGVSGWQWVAQNNEPAIGAWLYENGPISICVDARNWQYYTGGVFMASQCTHTTDHCVVITGWHINTSPPYWMVRNSWGAGWGLSGYINVQYNADACALAQYTSSCNT